MDIVLLQIKAYIQRRRLPNSGDCHFKSMLSSVRSSSGLIATLLSYVDI